MSTITGISRATTATTEKATLCWLTLNTGGKETMRVRVLRVLDRFMVQWLDRDTWRTVASSVEAQDAIDLAMRLASEDIQVVFEAKSE